MDILGVGATAVTRWEKQYLAQQHGEFTESKVPLDANKRRIEELKTELIELECVFD